MGIQLFDLSSVGLFGGVALFVLRVILGQIFLVHGAKKITRTEGPGTAPYLVLGGVEMIAGFSMIVGFESAITALVLAAIVLIAVCVKLMSWKNQRYVSNIEYDVLLLAAALVILTLGPGVLALSQ